MTAKKVQTRQQQLQQGNLKSSMGSSWVEYYEWTPYIPQGNIGEFIMKVQGGKAYSWPNIDRQQAGQAVGGNADCKTDDKTGQLRWWKGKYPSLGAAYHQICKLFKDATALEKPLLEIKKEPGRPTKERKRFEQFAGMVGQLPKSQATVAVKHVYPPIPALSVPIASPMTKQPKMRGAPTKIRKRFEQFSGMVGQLPRVKGVSKIKALPKISSSP